MPAKKGEKLQLYYRGGNVDTAVEIQSLGDGMFLSSSNMRSSSEGDKRIMVKIGGESVDTYYDPVTADLDAIGVAANYVCVGATIVNDQIVAVWADNQSSNPSCISVDNDVVLSHADFPVVYDVPIQIISNNNFGGEIYINDKNNKPMLFSIKDMWDNKTGTKYFADFNLIEYITQLNVSMNHPVFVELVNVGLQTGLPAGGYSYSLRYIDLDGNGTAWSNCTPIINVVENAQSKESNYFQGAGTYGGVSNPLINTKYGIKLKIRINNIANYSYLELRRMSHNSGQTLSFIPQPENIQVISVNIVTNPFGIVEFIDDGTKQWGILADSSSEELSAVEKVNSIRYFLDRFVLMGPTYESKIIDTTNLFLASENNNIAYPVIKNLHQYGHSDIWNQTYRKSLMRGERYGWAVEFVDAAGTKSFAIPYKSDGVSGATDFTNHLMPNRRETISEDTLMVSPYACYCADVDSHDGASHSWTHEVFDDKESGNVKSLTQTIDVTTFGANTYKPFTPTGSPTGYQSNQKNLDGLGFRINDQAEGSIYIPKGWNPRIYSLGMCFHGIDETKLPDWVEGFSVLRTEPAGRVVCQGIGYYSLYESSPGSAHKNLGKIWFYSPDIDPNIGLASNIYDEILSNPDLFQVQLVAPLGFYSEIWGGKNIDSIGSITDLISYARILYDNGAYNLEAPGTIGWQDGFVSFGRWRNNAAAGNADMPLSIFNDVTQFIFNITDVDEATADGHVGRSQYLELTLASQVVGSADIYIKGETGDDYTFADPHVRKWHEPFYIINIIKNTASVPQQNVNTYLKTGHYQKLKSIIDYGIAGSLNLPLVDERYEDCVLCEEITGTHTGANNQPIVLTDSSKNWVTDELFGCVILNITDGSRGIIIANTLNTATVADLISGDGNDFDTNDAYVIFKYEDLYSIGYHTTGAAQANLKDTNANWTTDELKGYLIINTNDGSYDIITANTANAVTTTLAAGTDNDWDVNDNYIIIANRYIYVDGEPWLTNVPIGEFSQMMTDFAANGYYDDGNRNVYGLCYGIKLSEKESQIEFDRVHFDTRYVALGGALTFFEPAQDDEIVVRYDNRIPIKVFGGDTYIGDSLFVPIDSQMELDASPVENADNCFHLHIAFPYQNYRLHTNYIVPVDKLGTENNQTLFLNNVRQMACLFTCESRVNLPLLYNDSFPKKNYVIRPLKVDSTKFPDGAAAVYDDHKFWQYYENDYEDEYLNWQYGGFHFPGTSNIDYSKKLLDSANYTQPAVGFSEVLYFPNRTIWSLRRLKPGIISSLKAFPVLNVFNGSDQQGKITYAYHANTSKGDNLYAITEKGVCLLITDKNILSDLTGGEIGIMSATESFIAAEYWLSKDVGMDLENWRTAAEEKDVLFFADKESVYKFENNVLDDIGRQGWHKKIFNEGLDKIEDPNLVQFIHDCETKGHPWNTIGNDTTNPDAYYYNKKTYQTWMQRDTVGGYDSRVMIWAYNHHTNIEGANYDLHTISQPTGDTDHHVVPAVIVADDGHIIVVHEFKRIAPATHNDAFVILRSDNVEDETSWVNAKAENANYYTTVGDSANIRLAYPNLLKDLNGYLYIICRRYTVGGRYTRIFKSTDHGISWNAGYDITDSGNNTHWHYPSDVKTGTSNTLRFAIRFNDNAAARHTKIYYLESDDEGVTWKDISGSHSQNIVTGGAISQATLDNAAYDYRVVAIADVGHDNIYSRSGTIDDNGIPYISTVEYDTPSVDWGYRMFWWNGSSWTNSIIKDNVGVRGGGCLIHKGKNEFDCYIIRKDGSDNNLDLYNTKNLTTWSKIRTVKDTSGLTASTFTYTFFTFNYKDADYWMLVSIWGTDALYSDLFIEVRAIYTTPVNSVFDKKHREYWLYIKDGATPQVFVFSLDNVSDEYPFGMWVSKFEYDFDYFLAHGLETYGLKTGKFYKLNTGTQIGGTAIDADITQALVAEFGRSSEFVDIKVYSDNKPTRIFFDRNKSLLESLNLSKNGRFDNWTGDDPDSWGVTGEAGVDPEVSQVGPTEGHGGTGKGACNIYTTGADLYIYKDILTIGNTCLILISVTKIVGGGIKFRAGSGDSYTEISTEGIYGYLRTAAGSTRFRINRIAACDVTIDDVYVISNPPEAMLSSVLGTNYLRDYGYWYNKIPRISAGSNYRIQGRIMYFKIIHSAEEDFKLSATSIGFKNLRLH